MITLLFRDETPYLSVDPYPGPHVFIVEDFVLKMEAAYSSERPVATY
jgi:hypothetical protein